MYNFKIIKDGNYKTLRIIFQIKNLELMFKQLFNRIR